MKPCKRCGVLKPWGDFYSSAHSDNGVRSTCKQCALELRRARDGFPKARRTLAHRFWEKVKKNDGCWGWSAADNGKGYGSLHLDGTKVLAHRVSWELHFGPIPDGLNVLHHCDNPPCVRPDHLFLGGQVENALDCIAKGRHSKPPVLAKVTPADVVAIRASNERRKVLAARYGVTRNQIWMIRSGRSWPGIEICRTGALVEVPA